MDSETPSRDGADLALLTRPADALDEMIEAAVPPPVCEWQEDGMPSPCGMTATWLCAMACGHSFYYCDEHKAAREAFVNQPGSNYCRGNLDKGRLHSRAALADPVRFERIER